MNIKLIMENWNKFLNEKVDQNKDGENDGRDVRIARMKASGMSEDEIKKKYPDLYSESAESEEKPIEEAEEGAFAPNHYCVHHGGVQHEGRIIEAEAIQHNYDFDLGRVTHYDMKLPDGTILEDVAAEDILITKASLAEKHGKRDHKKIKKIKEKKCPSCKKTPCEC